MNDAELLELCEKSAPGPWVVDPKDASKVISECPCCGHIATCSEFGPPSGKWKFDSENHYHSAIIAAARTELPRLLREKQEAERLLREARSAIVQVPDKELFGIGGEGMTHWYLADELVASIDAALKEPKP